MRTVPTLCASGAGIILSSIGLNLAREGSPSDPSRDRDADMTAIASYTLATPDTRVPNLNFTTHRSFSTPRSKRLGGWTEDGRTNASEARTGQRRSLTLGASTSIMDRPSSQREADDSSRTGTPSARVNARPSSLLRRLSSSISTSRDSSQTPTSRPGSAAVSQSNGSIAFSHTGPTTPMFPDNTFPVLPPNKLVKRASSLRSKDGSPFSSPGSRLPLPVLRRPATSHQRSETLHERLSNTAHGEQMSLDGKSTDARDPPLSLYFTPKVASDHAARRRSSTGIPNPIRRIYPDRKYTPILVSAREVVGLTRIELDDGISVDDESIATTKLRMASSVASSPLPAQTATFNTSPPPRRSFSIGDLLSTGPQLLWRRPSSRGGRGSSGKLTRRGRPRVNSAPHSAMGSSLSHSTSNGSERPTKRRDLSDPQAAQRSVYSFSSSKYASESPAQHEIPLNLAAMTPQSSTFNQDELLYVETPAHAPTSSLFEQRMLPSATVESTSVRHARVSATQSDIQSTLGSDSEDRSVGGYSTDYQSDTVYDSFPTRTTRSGSGKRGPPIDTIFDESPPTFSSGRSTRLRDLLSDGHLPGSEHSQRYRHSTIEEEDSVISTPVRSLHDKSVTSTPSARPSTERVFSSSPPVVALPDTDEIDWNVTDDLRMSNNGLGIQQHAFVAPTSRFLDKALPQHLSAFSRSANAASADSTPIRNGNVVPDKATLFDWSEQQPSPNHYNHSPTRPRTVHGKKDPENRGSRPTGRRVPSGMHARSHSVPIAPDVDGKRHNVVANKFGTWGVGSKAVTEDWNEDFDFDEPSATRKEAAGQSEMRIDSGYEILVPRSIKEQQESVMANIGLLREWGLLIEELKELRIRAVQLDMLNGQYAQAWDEVDAMIELADQESEEETLEPRKSPPSSPGFDYSAFEFPLPNIAITDQPRVPSLQLPDAAMQEDAISRPGPRSSSQHSAQIHSFMARPRKDSEAVARSVIEALQAKRSVSDPTTLTTVQDTKKVPFDTATLKHIVPYVNGLKRKIKDALRETEGLYSSPRRRSPSNHDHESSDDEEPAFRCIFNEPQQIDIADERRSRRETEATDRNGSDELSVDQSAELAKHMQTMRLSQ